MRAKIQIGIGLFVAIVVGIGIIITAKSYSALLTAGVLVFLALLGTYTLAIIMKKRILSKIIVLLWCASWIVPFILAVVGQGFVDFSDYDYFFVILFLWPCFVFEQFFSSFGFRFDQFFSSFGISNDIYISVFSGTGSLLIAALLWIGIHGVSQLVKAKNESNKKSLSGQKDKDLKDDQKQ